TTVAGTGVAGYSGDGGAATSAELNYPDGIAIDASGQLVIADNLNQRVRRVGTNGVISTIAGIGTSGFSGDGGAPTAAQPHTPADGGIDQYGRITIGDASNGRVRQIQSTLQVQVNCPACQLVNGG